jgi:hypothetical protein
MDAPDECLSHLHRLANALTERGLKARFVGVATPKLRAANAAEPTLNEQIECYEADGTWSFWWPSGQCIGSVDELRSVVDRIATVLRGVEIAG